MGRVKRSARKRSTQLRPTRNKRNHMKSTFCDINIHRGITVKFGSLEEDQEVSMEFEVRRTTTMVTVTITVATIETVMAEAIIETDKPVEILETDIRVEMNGQNKTGETSATTTMGTYNGINADCVDDLGTGQLSAIRIRIGRMRSLETTQSRIRTEERTLGPFVATTVKRSATLQKNADLEGKLTYKAPKLTHFYCTD